MTTIIINSDIETNTIFYSNNTYIINDIVNVINNSILTIEDDVLLLLTTNIGNLIFENGSSLKGHDINIGSCDENNVQINETNVPTEQNNKIFFRDENTTIKAKSLLIQYIGTVQFNNFKKENYDISKLLIFNSGKNGLEVINSTLNILEIYIKNLVVILLL